jgi:opacity protein-like surface antigen
MKKILATLGAAVALCAAAQTAGATPPQAVTITSTFIGVGDLSAGTTAGGFCVAGAIADCGTLAGDYAFSGLGHLKTGDPNAIHSDQTLTGRDGTIKLSIDGLYGPFVDSVTTGSGRWVIVGGTGAYTRLHGDGSWTATADFTAAFLGQGPPVVQHLDIGQVHWD